MNIIIGMVHFMVIYCLLTILYQQIVIEVNARKKPPNAVKRNSLYCSIIIDAGSTESKVLAAAFCEFSIKKSFMELMFCCNGFKGKADGSFFKLENQFFQTIEGGLAQYANDEKKREEIIRNLFEIPEAFMNKNPDCGRTPLLFRITADLKSLCRKTDEIINQVKKIVNEYGKVLKVDENSVAIMDDDDEAIFKWLSINFLYGNLKTYENTVAILDLGRESLQITYYIPNDEKHIVNNIKYIKQRTIMGVKRQFYNQNYLGFGLMEIRTKIFKPIDINELNVTSPCHHATNTLSYTFNSKTYSVTNANLSTDGHGYYENCLAAVQSLVIETVVKVTLLKDILATSFFYDLALETTLFDEKYSGSFDTRGVATVKRLNDATIEYFTRDIDDKKPFKCFDLTYIVVLLRQGFGFSDNTTIAKYFNGFEFNWILGAAYQQALEDIQT